MSKTKQVIIGFIDQKKTTNEKILMADMSLDDLMELGDFKSGQFETIWNTKSVKSLTIAIYENASGENKRRVGAGSKRLTKDQGIESFKAMADSLGVTVDRALEIHFGGKG